MLSSEPNFPPLQEVFVWFLGSSSFWVLPDLVVDLFPYPQLIHEVPARLDPPLLHDAFQDNVKLLVSLPHEIGDHNRGGSRHTSRAMDKDITGNKRRWVTLKCSRRVLARRRLQHRVKIGLCSVLVDEVTDVGKLDEEVLGWRIGTTDEHVAILWHQLSVRWTTPFLGFCVGERNHCSDVVVREG